MFSRKMYKKPTRIDDKVVIITGANCGLGKESAIDLARKGGKVYIACRDIKRGDDALKEIKEKSGSNNIHFIQMDLASMESIRSFVKNFQQVENRLHILMLNAGVMGCPRSMTQDGFEMHFGVNYLGHFLLTNLLIDMLQVSAPSRIVMVSSESHRLGKIHKKDLMCEKSYGQLKVYAQSKLAMNLFANELTRRLQGVTVNTCNPAPVCGTEIYRYESTFVKKYFLEPIAKHLVKTPYEGAQTQIRLAVDPELESVTGGYYDNCIEVPQSKRATDSETAAWLYTKSLELVGLSK